MAFITPNATDTSSGNRYASIDQAEPDALDLEILGNDLTGTVSGCAVTSNGSNANVAVAAGVVVIGGTTYNVAANPTLSIPSSPADNRFDLVVARVSGSSAVLAVVSGNNSSDNPVFPKSINVLDGGTPYHSALHVDLANETVLAALYRRGAQAVTDAHIVDKRVIRSVSILLKGTGAPGSGVGVPGSLYQDTSVSATLSPATTTSSGVYIKVNTTEWIPLARDLGPSLPIGGTIGWPSVGAVPLGCLEANGQSLSTTTYSDLFAALGGVAGVTYPHGGSGGTFNLPNYNGKYLRGTTSTVTLLTTVGDDTRTLVEANLPIHDHSMAHTHTLNSHTHNFAHYHTGTAVNAGAHTHTLSGGVTSSGDHRHVGTTDNPNVGSSTYSSQRSPIGYYNGTPGLGGTLVTPYYASDSGNATTTQIATGLTQHTHSFATGYGGTHSHGDTFAVVTGGSHNHSVTVDALDNTRNTAGSGTQTGTPSNNNTGPSSAANTGNAGSGTSFDNRPASAHIRWIIRATNANISL